MTDTRGYSCPLPVVMVQQEIRKKHPDRLEVLVDNEAARGNITRFAVNQGYAVQEQSLSGGETCLVLQK